MTRPGGPVMVTVSQRKWRALVGLTVMGLLLGATSILFTVAYVNITHDEIVAQGRAAHNARVKADDALVGRLCSTFGGIAALTPPAGSAAKNPSRAYEQELHAKLADVSPDLGCPP